MKYFKSLRRVRSNITGFAIIKLNLLVEFINQKQKAPAFYKNRPSDVDQSLLTVIPEAPRVAGTSYPKHWDWRILEAEDVISRGMKKVSSAEIDSAFGSAESTTKNFSRSMEQVLQYISSSKYALQLGKFSQNGA